MRFGSVSINFEKLIQNLSDPSLFTKTHPNTSKLIWFFRFTIFLDQFLVFNSIGLDLRNLDNIFFFYSNEGLSPEREKITTE
jgi:hypothetical protein